MNEERMPRVQGKYLLWNETGIRRLAMRRFVQGCFVAYRYHLQHKKHTILSRGVDLSDGGPEWCKWGRKIRPTGRDPAIAWKTRTPSVSSPSHRAMKCRRSE